jgi:hypothetical protein
MNQIIEGQKLGVIHEMFLLSLRTLDPGQPLYSNVQDLEEHFNESVSY